MILIQAQADLLCPQRITKRTFENQVLEVKKKFFPELSAIEVDTQEFSSDIDYFHARPLFISLFGEKRRYQIFFNTKLYECSPGSQALEAVLVHEFEHIIDYESKSFFQMLKLAIIYLINDEFRIAYERATDLKSLNKGVSVGLIEYRRWLYLQLSADNQKKKFKYYLNPNEIEHAEKELINAKSKANSN